MLDLRSHIGRMIYLSADAHKYSCAMVHLSPEEHEKVKAASESIADEDLAEDGREETPHVTLKYGLHTNDHRKVRGVLQDEPPISMTLGHTKVFPANDKRKADVVVVAVNSPDLHRINKKISAALPHTDTYSTYEPHMTLAYVKPGMGKKYAGKSDFAGMKIQSGHVVFSDKENNESHLHWIPRSWVGKNLQH